MIRSIWASRKRSTLLAAAMVWAMAAALSYAPPSVARTLRGGVLDGVVSIQTFAIARYDRWRSQSLSAATRESSDDIEPSEAANLKERSLAATAADTAREQSLNLECRRLRVENARLREELKLAENYGVSPIPVRNSSPVKPSALRVALIPTPALGPWNAVSALSGGQSQGVAESSLVVADGPPRIDAGSDAGLEPELDVFVGRCLVGRVASVGRWTSTLELISDTRYRGLAQIVRPSDQGGSFGAQGILVGLGNGRCKLTEVPTTQTVRVGDEVYTSDRDVRTSVPLYYGRIVRVDTAGRHWEITVEPAVKPRDLKAVLVLKLPPALGKILAE